MFCMFFLVPKAGDMVGSEYTMANTLLSWKMEQKLLEAAPLPFWSDEDGKLEILSTGIRTRTNLLGLKTLSAKADTDATSHLWPPLVEEAQKLFAPWISNQSLERPLGAPLGQLDRTLGLKFVGICSRQPMAFRA